MYEDMTWLNEPPRWSITGPRLSVTTAARGDFWRNTFYGYIRDDGHFFARPVSDDFTAEVSISGKYEVLYDQAGLMLRVDERNWLKTGVEHTDGAMHFSVVITRDDFSDWSVLPVGISCRSGFRVRLTRHGEALRVQYREPGGHWRLARLGYLPMPDTVQVGVTCCTPERAGFEVEFDGFAVGPAISKKLHED